MLNCYALVMLPYVALFRKELTVPHLRVETIDNINFSELEKKGFCGIVYDKDNTLTLPHSYELHPRVKNAFEKSKNIFGDAVAIFSDGVGTKYDSGGADLLEKRLEVPVIRHRILKPCGAGYIERHFKCEGKYLVMIGDSILDVVLGNRSGMLTIKTEPLSNYTHNFCEHILRRSGPSLRKLLRCTKGPLPHGILNAIK
ncbi:MAG: YqeG family HAD IIIA-type phosphatase [Candidatus Woesearchaeota archaeon]